MNEDEQKARRGIYLLPIRGFLRHRRGHQRRLFRRGDCRIRRAAARWSRWPGRTHDQYAERVRRGVR
jgi:hypothetical protein